MPIHNQFYLIDKKLNTLALQSRGPIMNVEVSVPTSLAEVWGKQGEKIPPPQAGIALLDSGASNTCVDRDVVEKLGIPSIGIQRVYTPQGSQEQNKYPARIAFPGTTLLAVDFGSVTTKVVR